jgi:hypothetical protein
VLVVNGAAGFLRRWRFSTLETSNGSVRTEWDAISSFRGVSEGDVVRYAIAKPEPLVVELAPPDFDIRLAILRKRVGSDDPPVEPEVVAQLPEPIAAPVEPPVQLAAQPAVATPEPALEISLGSSIIASGIVRRPVVAANDPLAPIRRMSQAEKIAFFS